MAETKLERYLKRKKEEKTALEMVYHHEMECMVQHLKHKDETMKELKNAKRNGRSVRKNSSEYITFAQKLEEHSNNAVHYAAHVHRLATEIKDLEKLLSD